MGFGGCRNIPVSNGRPHQSVAAARDFPPTPSHVVILAPQVSTQPEKIPDFFDQLARCSVPSQTKS